MKSTLLCRSIEGRRTPGSEDPGYNFRAIDGGGVVACPGQTGTGLFLRGYATVSRKSVTEEECPQPRSLFEMTARCALKGNSRSSTCRVRHMASPDAPQSLSAVADTRQTSLFATAPTRRPECRTSSLLGSFPPRNRRSNPPPGHNFLGSAFE